MPDTQRPTAAEAHDLLRAMHEPHPERQGVPMILALVDERGSLDIDAAAESRREGARYAELLDAYTELLTPEPAFPADDEGGLIVAMTAVAHRHFEPSQASSSEAGR